MPTSLNIDGAVFRAGGGQPCKVRLGTQSIMDVPGVPRVFSVQSRLWRGVSNEIIVTADHAIDGGSRLTLLRVQDNGNTNRTAVASISGFRPAWYSLGPPSLVPRIRPPASIVRCILPGTSLATSVSIATSNLIGASEATAYTASTASASLTTVSLAFVQFESSATTAGFNFASGIALTISQVQTQ